MCVSILKKISLIKKFAFTITIIHLSGSLLTYFYIIYILGEYAKYNSLDRVFDGLYPFFKEDLNKFLIEEKERNQIINSNEKELNILLEKSIKSMKK